jgi:5-methylcytosine-specific restriction protein A
MVDQSTDIVPGEAEQGTKPDGDSFYEQDRELIARLLEGASQAEIAREFGITREWVRQRLSRNGFKGRNYRWIPDRSRLVRVLSDAGSFEEAAEKLALTPLRLRTAINHQGAVDALQEAQERWRQHLWEKHRYAYQSSLVLKIRARALQVGHTPTQGELRAVGVHHVELNRIFDSVPNAMRAAGLIPNDIGRPAASLPATFIEMFAPTTDLAEAYHRAEEIRASLEIIPEPAGFEHPAQLSISTSAYYRDPRVVAWVLTAAEGACEACGTKGYETDSGVAYLEVHHVVPLSKGGADTVWNAVAVCETCHGKLHRWNRRAELEADLYSRIVRLRRPL